MTHLASRDAIMWVSQTLNMTQSGEVMWVIPQVGQHVTLGKKHDRDVTFLDPGSGQWLYLLIHESTKFCTHHI